MARRKNTKRIDPRYFLNETVNRNDDGSRLEEAPPPEPDWRKGFDPKQVAAAKTAAADKAANAQSLLSKTQKIIYYGDPDEHEVADLLKRILSLLPPGGTLQQRLDAAGKSPEKQMKQALKLYHELRDLQGQVSLPRGGDPYALDHEERGKRAKANWDREMYQRGGFRE